MGFSRRSQPSVYCHALMVGWGMLSESHVGRYSADPMRLHEGRSVDWRGGVKGGSMAWVRFLKAPPWCG